MKLNFVMKLTSARGVCYITVIKGGKFGIWASVSLTYGLLITSSLYVPTTYVLLWLMKLS